MTTLTRPTLSKPNDKFLFTVTAAARILGIETTDIEGVIPCDQGCLVVIWAGSVSIPRHLFEQDYFNFRKEATHNYDVKFNKNAYFVSFKDDPRRKYNVRISLRNNTVKCNCYDWQHSAIIFGEDSAYCKHSLAVLETHKYNSLSQWKHRHCTA